MFQSLEVLRTAQALAQHSGKRQAVVAGNVANADTPGYRRRDIPAFAEIWTPDPGGQMRATRAAHLNGIRPQEQPDARITERVESEPNGNSVSLETELMAGVEAKRAHDRALAVYRSGLTILRASLGRR